MAKDDVGILLVEDTPADAVLTTHALRQNNCLNRIDVASDGQEALDFVFCQGKHSQRDPNDPPALILLDLKLPRVSGIEVLRRVRADPRTRTIPVVILTSSKGDEDLIQSYQLSAHGFVDKLVDFIQFREALKRFALPWLHHDAPRTEGALSKE